ncbi:hypothetical protein BC828DRAFT_406876, partial [Blastocladiella britannica]
TPPPKSLPRFEPWHGIEKRRTRSLKKLRALTPKGSIPADDVKAELEIHQVHHEARWDALRLHCAARGGPLERRKERTEAAAAWQSLIGEWLARRMGDAARVGNPWSVEDVAKVAQLSKDRATTVAFVKAAAAAAAVREAELFASPEYKDAAAKVMAKVAAAKARAAAKAAAGT